MPYSLIRDLFSRRFEIRDSDAAAAARDKLEQGIVALWDAGDGAGVEGAHFIGQLIGFDFSESPHLRGIAGDARQIRDRAFHYVAQFFAALAQESPVALYLEDIHWADDGSLDLVDYLVWECRDAPLLTVALARPSLFERRPSWGVVDVPPERAAVHTRLELHPLSAQDSRRLVEEILHLVDEVPRDLQDLVVQRAEGNPYYVEELIKVLIEEGAIVKGEERWRVEPVCLTEVRVPPTLTGVLQARLDRLAALERGTLQRASVVGRVFWDGAVEQIGKSANRQISKSANRQISKSANRQIGESADRQIGESADRQIGESADQQIGKSANRRIGKGDGVGEVLRALQGRELVFLREGSAFAGTREYIFKHAILRDVTYESVLRRLRRVYHAQVAAWLVEQSGERVGEYAGLIGGHYEQAGENAWAAEWYGRAGRQAQDTYALETALDYYGRALALEERWAWRKGQVEVLHVLGQREEEQAALGALEAAPGAPVFEVAYLWGQYQEAVSDYAQAQAEVERALALSRSQDDVLGQARCLSKLGTIAWRRAEYDEAKAWYNRALGLFQRQGGYSGEEAQAFVQILNGLGTVHRQQGDFDQARLRYKWALDLSRQSGNRWGEAQALNRLGITAFYQRRFNEALLYLRQALEIQQAIGDRAGEGASLNDLAMAARGAGDYGRAIEYSSAALVILQAVGNRWDEVNVWNSLGITHRELGDMSNAQACWERGLALAQEIGDEAGQAYILSNLGPVVCDQGDLETAEKLLTDGLALVQAQADKYAISYFLSHLGLVNLWMGRFAQAVDRANAALTLRREIDLHLWATADLTTLASAHLAAGDTARALEYARQAVAILDECGGEGPEFPQRDYFICYQVLSAAGQEETARAALQSAYDLVTTRADKISDPALRQSFLERVPINREIVQEYDSVMRET